MPMKLHLLGVNGPFPESGGATSGYLLEFGNDLFQLDFGCGILSSLTSIAAPEAISALLITHWHFDHISDLPVLMYRLEACGCTLPVYGPADPASCIYRLVSSSRSFSFTEVQPNHPFHIGQTEILPFAARHPVPAVGYRVTSGDTVFCYTGDTNTLSSLAEDCRNCDLLLADGLFTRALWTESKPHLSAELAARLALDSETERLIITHLNPFISRQSLLDEARSVFLSSMLAAPGLVIEL